MDVTCVREAVVRAMKACVFVVTRSVVVVVRVRRMSTVTVEMDFRPMLVVMVTMMWISTYDVGRSDADVTVNVETS